MNNPTAVRSNRRLFVYPVWSEVKIYFFRSQGSASKPAVKRKLFIAQDCTITEAITALVKQEGSVCFCPGKCVFVS